MSASINSEVKDNDHNDNFNYDEIEKLISDESEICEINTENRIANNSTRTIDERLESQQTRSSSAITQVQSISLSLEKSIANIEENSQNQSSNKSKASILTTKTSNIPGPVGLLPILVRFYFL